MRAGFAVAAAAALITSLAPPGDAQPNLQGVTVRELPRPGYERRPIRLGAVTLSPELTVGAELDSNIFATSRDAEADVLTVAAPALGLRYEGGRLKLSAAASATLRDYADNHREGVDTYAISGSGSWSVAGGHLLRADGGAERNYERRSDPEADVARFRRPARIDRLRGGLGYQYRGSRLGLGVRGDVERSDYLSIEDDDRDVTGWRGAVRATAAAVREMDVYLEAYALRRDADSAVDRTGVDRDTRTRGLLAGAALHIDGRWEGEIGVGAFRANPADPSLRAFSGVAASGSLVWRPRLRTSLTLDLFRGDVATVRAGATGRIDGRASLRVDQEVRHNVLLAGTVGVRDTRYRGISRRQTSYSAELEATYLANRVLAIVGAASVAKRTASERTDRFERYRVGLSTRIAY